jgi:hypothetical protein
MKKTAARFLPCLNQAPTGIAGFDEITRGGIACGRTPLLALPGELEAERAEKNSLEKMTETFYKKFLSGQNRLRNLRRADANHSSERPRHEPNR